MSEREVGTVKWFDAAKGYGFVIKDSDKKDIFVHHTAIQKDGYRTLEQGQKVEFTIGEGRKGPQAQEVSLVD